MIESSKSLMNRALIVKSYFPDLKIVGDSSANDVVALKRALKGSFAKNNFDCREAGTVLRFLAFRVARETGRFRLIGSPRLFSRPQRDLLKTLGLLGSHVRISADELNIQSSDWKIPAKPLTVAQSQSSQFISGLLLNAWNLPSELRIRSTGKKVSDAYLQMTIDLLQSCGMRIQRKQGLITVPTAQKLKVKTIRIEPDMSSAFAYCANTLLRKNVVLRKFPHKSLQPDFIFVQILKKMGLQIRATQSSLKIEKAQGLKALHFDLNNTPDLFPVLACLCAFAEGESRLTGAEQLVHKESNRLKRTAQLLKQAGVPHKLLRDGIVIQGRGRNFIPATLTFDPDQDHRMAMAVAVFKGINKKIKIKSPSVVNKSYPDFWKDIGVRP